MNQINISPSKYLFMKTLSKITRISYKKAKTWVIAPSSTVKVSKPICLADETQRVGNITRWSSAKIEDNRLFGDEIEYPASHLTELNNATIADWNIYQDNTRLWQTETAKFTPLYFGGFKDYDSAFLCSTLHRNQFFGHWLTDQLATELLAENYSSSAISCLPVKPYGHSCGYRKIVNIHSTAIKRSTIKTLIVAHDIAHNKSRQDRLLEIRKRLTPDLNSSTNKYPIVFLARGSTGSLRELVNEKEVAEWVKSEGGKVVYPESSSVVELQLILSSSKIVIGVEGSSLTHAIMLMPSNSTLLVIQPPNRFHNILKTYADVIGHKYAFVVATQTPQGFIQPLERLKRLYDLVNANL